jgi:outer membrane lipopolysaccharide assembly protein LptE/RlpB
MWLKTFSRILIVFTSLQVYDAKGYKYLKIEECSSSNKTFAEFKSCKIIEEGLVMNFSIHVKRPLDKVIV